MPVFQSPSKCWTVDEVSGIYARFRGQTRRIFKSAMHNRHTVSLYAAAHRIRDELRTQSLVRLTKVPSAVFKEVNIQSAKCQTRHQDQNVLWLNAFHKGQRVVLKTTSDPAMQLTYILEAVVHFFSSTRCTTYIPRLHFIGFASDNRLVVCSEQLTIPSVTQFVNRLPSEYGNPDISLWFMCRAVCLAIRRLQNSARFTHRDCHTSNVYYDMRSKRVQFIDFDWSCVRWQDKTISVPRVLYDTTRPEYGYNRSVDCCVFFRTLGPAIGAMKTFVKRIYLPLMQRYEKESEIFLKRRMGTDTAAMQMYRLSTKDGTMKGKFAHKYGVHKLKNKFDYHMAYYTWECMTPAAIILFLDEHKFF